MLVDFGSLKQFFDPKLIRRVESRMLDYTEVNPSTKIKAAGHNTLFGTAQGILLVKVPDTQYVCTTIKLPIVLVPGLGRLFLGNGQKREYPVLFWPKTDVPENNSGRECCWPYLIGKPPPSPVFGQKRPGTPGNSYFAQLPPVFGHFMFLSGGLLDCSNR